MVQAETQVRKAVGKILAERRATLGWTLAKVSERAQREGVKISLATLHRLERGQARLPLASLVALCRALGASLSEIESVLYERRVPAQVDLTGQSSDQLVDEALQQVTVGAYPRALELLQTAEDLLVLQSNGELPPEQMAEVLIRRADLHARLRQFRASLDCAWRALNLKDISEDARLRAILIHARVGEFMEEFGRARLFTEHAQMMLDRVGPRTKAYALGVIGVLEYKQERFAEAIPLLEEARRLYAEQGVLVEVARLGAALGRCHQKLGRPQAGRRFIDDARRVAVSNGFLAVVALALRLLAAIDHEEGRYEQAVEEYEQAATIARRLELNHELFMARQGQWRIHRELGDEARAARIGAQLKRLLGQIDVHSHMAQEFLAAIHGDVARPPEARQ